jgi:hypothetical protein
VVEVPLISFSTNRVVATGIGAASTNEVKYKYRWERDPGEWGYSDDAIKTLKSRIRDGKTQYRIPNPEHGELVNTIVKMASKRAEVDAVETLPGVSSALRDLFNTKSPERRKPDWAWFWSELGKRGLKEEGAHELLGIKSFKELLTTGFDLQGILNKIDEKLAEVREESAPVPPEAPPKPKPERDLEALKNLNDLYSACNQDFGLQPADVIKELGYSSQLDITESPAEAYRIIASPRT